MNLYILKYEIVVVGEDAFVISSGSKKENKMKKKEKNVQAMNEIAIGTNSCNMHVVFGFNL